MTQVRADLCSNAMMLIGTNVLVRRQIKMAKERNPALIALPPKVQIDPRRDGRGVQQEAGPLSSIARCNVIVLKGPEMHSHTHLHGRYTHTSARVRVRARTHARTHTHTHTHTHLWVGRRGGPGVDP